MSKSLDGKHVVIIGGATGIGFAVAELAVSQGAKVTIGSSREASVSAAAKRLGATGRVVDVRDEASVAAWFAALGAFDHLVLTAGDWGGGMFAAAADLDLVATREMLNVRFWGVLAAVKHATKTIAPMGSITLTSGMLAHRPFKGAPVAAAIGGALEHLARGLAMDLAPVRVNAVCPGLVLTEHVQQMPEERLRAMTGGLPIPRTATPAEAATAYVYLMVNAYTTGQILHVDGGGLLV